MRLSWDCIIEILKNLPGLSLHITPDRMSLKSRPKIWMAAENTFNFRLHHAYSVKTIGGKSLKNDGIRAIKFFWSKICHYKCPIINLSFKMLIRLLFYNIIWFGHWGALCSLTCTFWFHWLLTKNCYEEIDFANVKEIVPRDQCIFERVRTDLYTRAEQT